MKTLVLRQIRLLQFRNFAEATFAFGEKFNLVTGLNGVGKTSLLDAIYYLCVGRSYFTVQDQKVVRQGESYFRLEGAATRNGETMEVVMKVRPGASKDVLHNGLPLGRVSEHLGHMPVVFSAPRDIDLVTGTSQVRRRYFDQLLCQTDHAYLASLQAYNHLLALRNAALKQRFQGIADILDTYDMQMSPHAALIHTRRKELAEQLKGSLQQVYAFLSDDAEPVGIAYDSQLDKYAYPLSAQRARDLDLLTQRSNAGIHKDDFPLYVRGLAAREFASQGQLKSLVFALHLSKYALLRDRAGVLPLVLLDDIFDKLDERRLSRLMETLTGPAFGQVFISDTSASRVAAMLSAFPIHEIPIGERMS